MTESVILSDEVLLDVGATQQGEVVIDLSEEELTQLLEETSELENYIEWV